MKRSNRKLALHRETLRVLATGALAFARGGVPNYNTSIDHNGCSGPTIKDTCFTQYTHCGAPCELES